MIPEFDENGNLPPGVHWVEWEEFEEQFNYNSTRQRLIDGLKLAMTHLSAAGCRTIYINGSFTTIVTPTIKISSQTNLIPKN